MITDYGGVDGERTECIETVYNVLLERWYAMEHVLKLL